MANFQELTTNGAQVTGVNTDIFPWLDVSSFKSFSLQLNGTFTATITYQVSNDATNPLSGIGYTSIPTTIGLGSVLTAPNILTAPIISRYIRFRCTAFTSNTNLSAILELYETPSPVLDMYIAPQGNLTVQQGNGSAGGIATQWGMVQSQKNAVVAVGAGNTVIKNAVGYLTTIVVTTAGTTGFQVFDNASTNSGNQLYASKTAPALGDIYNIFGAAANGIVVANTATGPALTVFYT